MRGVNKIDAIGKKFLLYGTFLFLFVPLIQTVTHVKWEEPLGGAFSKEQDIFFSWKDWFSGRYSDQKDKWLKENFGLRDYLIRVISQVNYTAFKKTNTSFLVVGKDNYLYETTYIDAYYGRDFIGQRKIDDYVKKLKIVQDTFWQRNKLVMVVFAPGKACYFPEYIPDNYKSPKTVTNYEGFSSSARKTGLNHIDFYDYFIRQKNKSPYPLYPQLGIHWSNYSIFKVFDSILSYSENKLNCDLPDLRITRIVTSDTLRSPDNDAVKSLNLMKDPKTFKMAYPEWIVEYNDAKHAKLNLLVISDSFWWSIYGAGLTQPAFASSSFWYYNKQMYPESNESSRYVTERDYTSRLHNMDIIIILHSESTLSRFGCGFVDMAYETIIHPGYKKERILEMKNRMIADTAWYKQIREKAGQKNITVDSMLTIDAIYMLDTQPE